MSVDDNMVEKGSDISAQATNTTGVNEQVLSEWGGVDGTALVEAYENEIIPATEALTASTAEIMKADGIHTSWLGTLKEKAGEFTNKYLPKHININWKNVGTGALSVTILGSLLIESGCAPKPVSADTQPTPDATQTLAVQVEESQVIPDTPENIEKVPEEDIYPAIPDTQAMQSPVPEAPTQEVVEEYPEVDFSFDMLESFGYKGYKFTGEDLSKGNKFYYGIYIPGVFGSAIGGSADGFWDGPFSQSMNNLYSDQMEHVYDWKLLNKYMTYRNEKSEIGEDGTFSQIVIVVEETNGKGEKTNRFFDPKGAIQLTMNGETRPISDDEIPWDDLPKEAWELIKEGYKDITIGENGEISADCFFPDYVHKADNPTVGEE